MSAEDEQIQRWLVLCYENVFEVESTGLVLLCMCEYPCKLFYMEAFQKPESEPRVVTCDISGTSAPCVGSIELALVIINH